jgi:hypothetical protein
MINGELVERNVMEDSIPFGNQLIEILSDKPVAFESWDGNQ